MILEHPLIMPQSDRLTFFKQSCCRYAAWQQNGCKRIWPISRRFKSRVQRHKRCTAHTSHAWVYGPKDMWQ